MVHHTTPFRSNNVYHFDDTFNPPSASHQSLPPLHLYYKVPMDQRRANPEAYHPCLFSFGPYHSVCPCTAVGDPANCPRRTLGDGDHLKRMVEAELLLFNDHEDKLLESLVSKIGEHEFELRLQYVQWLDGDKTPFRNLANILAFEAITIVAATLDESPHGNLKGKIPLIYPLRRLILSDGILLENQIPVIVLECALRSIAESKRSSQQGSEQSKQLPSLEDVIWWYCLRASPFPGWLRTLPPIVDDTLKGRPLLGYLYDHLCSGLSATDGFIKDHPAYPSLPTASHLARCGVQFAPCDTSIAFDSRKSLLLLPKIIVSDTTVRVLHNLLAYEATSQHAKQYTIASYVHFMDCLIDTASDVHILTDVGIIINKLGSHEELASMWNRLCISISCRSTTSHALVMAQLETFSKKKWNKWKATFKELYWERQPWLLFSIAAASVLLILSLLQTIFTILSY